MGYIGGNSNTLKQEEYKENLTSNIDYELNNEAFISRISDGHKGVFSRCRKLIFKDLIILIISMRTAFQRELDSFVKAVSDSDFSIREVTKSAFSQARAKLNPWAFKRLNEVAVNSFYDGAPYKTWHNKRLMAIDETRLILPKHQTIIEKFGTKFFGPKAVSERSMAIGSVLYDVKNQICIDSEIDNFRIVQKLIYYYVI